jgi:Tfp pilus assembly protein PilN
MSLNLASHPFVNSRPVRRLVLVLWCLGALLIVANLFFYTRHFSGQQTRRDRLDALTEQQGREQDRLVELEGELAGFDLAWQNRQVEFLNLRIAERVFPWSRLFDRLTEAMPEPVRLTRLRPQIKSLSVSADGREETVQLEIRAEARDEEAMLEFVGQLFEHPAFRYPNLASENRRAKSNVTEFALTATYLPARAAAAPTVAAPGPATDTAPSGDTGPEPAEDDAAPEPAEDAMEAKAEQ